MASNNFPINKVKEQHQKTSRKLIKNNRFQTSGCQLLLANKNGDSIPKHDASQGLIRNKILTMNHLFYSIPPLSPWSKEGALLRRKSSSSDWRCLEVEATSVSSSSSGDSWGVRGVRREFFFFLRDFWDSTSAV